MSEWALLPAKHKVSVIMGTALKVLYDEQSAGKSICGFSDLSGKINALLIPRYQDRPSSERIEMAIKKLVEQGLIENPPILQSLVEQKWYRITETGILYLQEHNLIETTSPSIRQTSLETPDISVIKGIGYGGALTATSEERRARDDALYERYGIKRDTDRKNAI